MVSENSWIFTWYVLMLAHVTKRKLGDLKTFRREGRKKVRKKQNNILLSSWAIAMDLDASTSIGFRPLRSFAIAQDDNK